MYLKRFSLCFIAFLAVFHSRSEAQAAPTANRTLTFQAGVEAASFTLDFGEGREEGIGGYVDADVSFWHLGIEALYRNASIITPHDTGENHLLIGPRFHFQKGRFEPYAKFLVGRATINFQQGYNVVASSQSYGALAFGAGLDYRLTNHIILRPIDFESQRWPNFPPHGLTPNGFSAGAAYRF